MLLLRRRGSVFIGRRAAARSPRDAALSDDDVRCCCCVRRSSVGAPSVLPTAPSNGIAEEQALVRFLAAPFNHPCLETAYMPASMPAVG